MMLSIWFSPQFFCLVKSHKKFEHLQFDDYEIMLDVKERQFNQASPIVGRLYVAFPADFFVINKPQSIDQISWRHSALYIVRHKSQKSYFGWWLRHMV